MGEFHMRGLCYDEIADNEGKEAAQALWEKNGGRGKYVPGMVATPSLTIMDGGITVGHVEPCRRGGA